MKKQLTRTDWIILAFVMVKILIHILTNTNYSFHRDEFLYLDQGNHLAWGYMEVPPVIAFMAAFINSLGADLFVVRLFPALIGGLSIFLLGRMVKQLGGGSWAVVFACLAFLMAPSFLRSNSLFQPVSFNQFFWLLTAYWLVQLIRSENHRYWWVLGLTAGLGMMTKYSIAVYLLALFIGLLLRPHRKWWLTRHPYIALGLSLLIFLPNLLWQYQHHFPVLSHMEELRETQFVHVDALGFFTDQLFFFMGGTLIWLAGLIYLLFDKKAATYRPLGLGSLFALLIIWLLGGKSYYTIGAYSILLVFGGLAWEQYLSRKASRWALAAFLVMIVLPFLPFSLPLLPNAQMEKYCQYMVSELGMDAPMRWEDGEVYALPQDYADMNGWEEVAADIAQAFHRLSPEEQQNCLIYGGSYGHAGAINYYSKKYNIPKEAYSLNSSYMIWAPREQDFTLMLMADDVKKDGSDWFEELRLLDSIDHPYARDAGYIYLYQKPKVEVSEVWRSMVSEAKSEYGFK